MNLKEGGDKGEYPLALRGGVGGGGGEMVLEVSTLSLLGERISVAYNTCAIFTIFLLIIDTYMKSMHAYSYFANTNIFVFIRTNVKYWKSIKN